MPPEAVDYNLNLPKSSGRSFSRYRLSCSAAKRVLARNGFNRVVARDCSGRVYAFQARRNGHSFIVRVRAANARIVDVSRL